MSLQDNRREYDYGKLTRESLSDNPFEQFTLWMDQALEAVFRIRPRCLWRL